MEGYWCHCLYVFYWYVCSLSFSASSFRENGLVYPLDKKWKVIIPHTMTLFNKFLQVYSTADTFRLMFNKAFHSVSVCQWPTTTLTRLSSVSASCRSRSTSCRRRARTPAPMTRTRWPVSSSNSSTTRPSPWPSRYEWLQGNGMDTAPCGTWRYISLWCIDITCP